MKKLFLPLLLASTGLPAFGQYAFEAAETLWESVTVNEERAVPVSELIIDAKTAGLLVQFDDSLSALPPQSVTYLDIQERYARNPFLNERPSAKIRLVKSQRGIEGFLAMSKFPTSIAEALGMPVTGLVDGLAKFLVARTRQELSENFFRQLENSLIDQPEFGALFPSTRHALSTIAPLMSQPDAYIGLLREASESDFRAMPANVAGVLGTRQWLADSTAGRAALEMLATAQSLAAGTPLPTVLGRLADGRLAEYPELEGGFRIAHIYLEAFRNSSQASGYWLSPDKARKMLAGPDDDGFFILMGLLFQKYGELPVGRNTTFGQLLAENKADLQALRGMLTKMLQLAERLETTIAGSGPSPYKAEPQKNGAISGSDVLKIGLDLLCLGDELKTLMAKPGAVDAGSRGLVQNALLTLRHGATLEVQVRQQQYASAVVTVMDITGLWFKNTYVRHPILRLGSFLAALAGAESSDQVASAIEAFALPPGSAALKKRMAFSIGLNCYVGGYYGQEFVPNGPLQNGAVGLNSPVGLALNWGWRWGKTRSGKPVDASLSALLSVVDIGAVTAYRFRDSTAQELPEIKLGDIVSPGAFLILGLPCTPISIGGGLQYAPTLRSVGQAAGASNQLRWSVFIGVDIPIFHLYNRPRRNE